MKITFTFEYADLLVQVQKQLEMNGLRVLKNDNGEPAIRFVQKTKQVIVECEQGELSNTCPFCSAEVNRGVAQSTKSEERVNRNSDTAPSAQPNNETVDKPLTAGEIAQLRAQSNRIAAERERNGEGFRSRFMAGESEEPPFGGS